MNPTLITVIVGLAISAAGTVFVPLFIIRYTAKQAAKKDAASEVEKAAEDAAQVRKTDAISLNDVNLAIARERDALLIRLEKTEAAKDQEIRDLTARYDAELAQCRAKIADLNEQLNSMYRRLYGRENPGSR